MCGEPDAATRVLCRAAARTIILALGFKAAYSTVLDARGTGGIFTDSPFYAAPGFQTSLKGNCHV